MEQFKKIQFECQSDPKAKRGLLGIDILKRGIGQTKIDDYVFIYLTEETNKNSEGDSVRNRVYRYSWNGTDLINPGLLLVHFARRAWSLP